MIRPLIAAPLLLGACIAVPAAAQDTPPPAAVVVAFDRESITPLIAEGVRNFDSREPVAFNDPVRIASISKLILALAALRLMDEGKVDLDRDVSDYLGWKLRSPHHPDAPVTLAHLLSHRAGLSDAGGYFIPLGESLEAKLADPAAWRDVGPPGGRIAPILLGGVDPDAFEYANLGSPLVATALEAASGERYDRLVERLVFAPLGVKACLNWVGCGPEMEARAVALYRHTGEPARDFPGDLPTACAIPVADGVECTLDDYVPGTNASVFSPQGGVRIGMMDLAKIGQALYRLGSGEDDDFLSPQAAQRFSWAMRQTGQGEFFCSYGLHLQLIGHPGLTCEGDDLFGDGIPRIGHSGEAYALQSGLWIDPKGNRGFAYFRTQAPPPAGGEDTGGFTEGEKALIARAQSLLAQAED